MRYCEITTGKFKKFGELFPESVVTLENNQVNTVSSLLYLGDRYNMYNGLDLPWCISVVFVCDLFDSPIT